tara:strand:- start:6499 stop:7260 length:762 start_codon:yes stop_codon:yes gene_type:complete
MQDIYVEDIGSGYPLVLVHGFLGSAEMWYFQKKYLKRHARLIIPALPGFGENYKLKSKNSINKLAKFVLKIVKQKKIKQFNLLGHSMGGMIVQEIIKIDRKSVNKLICFATGPIGEIPGRFETIDETILRLKKDGIKKSIKRIPQNWFVKGKKDKNFYYCLKAVKRIKKNSIINALIAMKKWNGLKNLSKIKNKTLIIWGNKDSSYKYDQIKILNKNIINSKLQVLKNCAHNAHLEMPNKFNKILLKFLKSDE